MLSAEFFHSSLSKQGMANVWMFGFIRASFSNYGIMIFHAPGISLYSDMFYSL